MFDEPRSFYPSKKVLIPYYGKSWLLSILVAILIWLIFGGLLINIIVSVIVICSTLHLINGVVIIPNLKVTITSEWLRGYNIFFNYRFLNWQAIIKAEKVNHVRFSYYKIFSKGHSFPMFLPLFHENQAELERLICQYTPKDNPLHRLIKKEQNRKRKKAQLQQPNIASSE